MAKIDSIIDSVFCILFRLTGPLLRLLPKSFSLAVGRVIAGLVCSFDGKHRRIAYANIKTAFGREASPRKLAAMTRRFYRTFGENLMEIFFIPQVDKDYIGEYIEIVGRENVDAAFKKGKGVILLAMHEGSWELSNIICAHLAFPFNFFVRDQRYPRLDGILNQFRFQQGCRIIHRGNQLRQLLEVLARNEAIGITIDQGGKRGTQVQFFGREASMSTGAVKMALKSGAAVIPCFYVRMNGPYIRVIFESPYELVTTGDKEVDVRENLQGLVKRFQNYIAAYPKEYLWSYKIWKYGRDKRVLILSDDKAGHLRQSEAVADKLRAALSERENTLAVDIVEVKFKNRLCRRLLGFAGLLAGKRGCQGCLGCLKRCLDKQTYDSLIREKYDFVISCGSALGPVNFFVSRENLARSIAVMRPGLMSVKKFDLVVMPRHDDPPGAKNVMVSSGALNLVSEKYLAEQSKRLSALCGLEYPSTIPVIGLFIGGDNKDFCLNPELTAKVIGQVKLVAEKIGASILVTTSRRTSIALDKMLENEFRGYPSCKLLVIANKKNIPEAAGGILGLSDIVVVSPESISMVSEAASSKKYVFVFEAAGLGKRHQKFLGRLLADGQVYRAAASELSVLMEKVWKDKPQVRSLSDAQRLSEAVGLLI